MKKLPVSKKILYMLNRHQIVETSFSILKDRLQILNNKAHSITSFFHKHFLHYLPIHLIITAAFYGQVKQLLALTNFLIRLVYYMCTFFVSHCHHGNL